MNKEIIILGSTGSIGTTTLSVIKKQNFKISLLTTDKNAKKLLNQAISFKVKNVIIEDEVQYKKYKSSFNKNKIKIYLGLINLKKILKKKVNYCVNSISGIDGLLPTLDVIPFTQNILIANKESIICGWHLIKKKLIKHKVNFIPIDSEHFSIWSLIKNDNHLISKIYLTASGGPFLNTSKKKLNYADVKNVINHPKWSMGKKISTDSATMMNKVFEVIEASKIFNLDVSKVKIIIHPKSIIHALVAFNNGLIKILMHETKMEIPIFNIIFEKDNTNFYDKTVINFEKLNGINFIKPNKKKFPYLNILSDYKIKNTYFEVILVTINDELVNLFLNKKISFINMQKLLIKLIKKSIFKKYYNKKPKNISDINLMNNKVKKILINYDKIFQ